MVFILYGYGFAREDFKADDLGAPLRVGLLRAPLRCGLLGPREAGGPVVAKPFTSLARSGI